MGEKGCCSGGMEVTPPLEHDSGTSDVRVVVVLRQYHLSSEKGKYEASFDDMNGLPAAFG